MMEKLQWKNLKKSWMKLGRKIPNWNKKHSGYHSVFEKLICAFLIIGLIPLLITGQFLYRRLASSVENVVSSNASQIIYNFGVNIENEINDYKKIVTYPYEYVPENAMFLYELLKADGVSELEKESQIRTMLSNMLYMNSYIENVRFITDGNVYSVSRDTTKILKEKEALEKQWNFTPDTIRKYYVTSVWNESDCYYGANKTVLTIGKNYMDVSGTQSMMKTVLGTVSIDINPAQFSNFKEGIQLGENSYLAVYNLSDAQCIYSSENAVLDVEKKHVEELLKKFSGEMGTCREKNAMYAYSKVDGTNWIAVARLDQADINQSYAESRTYFIIMLGLISGLLGISYYLFSQQITHPLKIMEQAMAQLKQGKLDTRVAIQTHDEMETLGNGFNEMADDLQTYINKVFVAELRQKDAELEALKTTIRPHYLYNTLEVIRMSALTKQDMQVADMLGCLSKQLQYLIGEQSELVTLREELQNIKDYFYIVQVRFEDRFELEIDVDTSCMELHVLKLILQPIVENAVKHGLRPKSGNGKVSIRAAVEKNCLWITVMDNGVGMTDEKVHELEEKLKSPLEKTADKKASIGMKNVYDRIAVNYGEPYGFTILSMPGMGTSIKFCLPVLKEENENESGNCR